MRGEETTGEAQFRASLPDSYLRRHAQAAINRHAEIAQARGDARASVGVVDAPSGHLGLCVVALDSPGLFSHIAAAIRLHGYDIVHAEAYTRRTPEGLQEVFDLFRVQPQPHSGRAILTATPADVAAAISATLLDLIDGRLDPDQALPESVPPPDRERDTRVRFIEDEEGVLSTLEVETDDRSGLLLTLARALSALRVTIVRSEVRTRRGRVCDRFVVAEGDGSPISEERRLELQVSVLGAIEAPARRKHA